MTFAQFIGSGSEGIIGVLNTIIVPFIGTLIFGIFIWGVFKYFFWNNKGDVTKLQEGKDFVLWGILGMVVFFSVWGFVNILLSTLGIAPS